MVRMCYWLSIIPDAGPYLVQVRQSQRSTENEMVILATGLPILWSSRLVFLMFNMEASLATCNY